MARQLVLWQIGVVDGPSMRATILKVSYRCSKGLDPPKVVGQFAGTGAIQVNRR